MLWLKLKQHNDSGIGLLELDKAPSEDSEYYLVRYGRQTPPHSQGRRSSISWKAAVRQEGVFPIPSPSHSS